MSSSADLPIRVATRSPAPTPWAARALAIRDERSRSSPNVMSWLVRSSLTTVNATASDGCRSHSRYAVHAAGSPKVLSRSAMRCSGLVKRAPWAGFHTSRHTGGRRRLPVGRYTLSRFWMCSAAVCGGIPARQRLVNVVAHARFPSRKPQRHSGVTPTSGLPWQRQSYRAHGWSCLSNTSGQEVSLVPPPKTSPPINGRRHAPRRPGRRRSRARGGHARPYAERPAAPRRPDRPPALAQPRRHDVGRLPRGPRHPLGRPGCQAHPAHLQGRAGARWTTRTRSSRSPNRRDRPLFGNPQPSASDIPRDRLPQFYEDFLNKPERAQQRPHHQRVLDGGLRWPLSAST